jgi:hypothetical protein
MSYSTENLAEINLLIRYKSSASLEGIKMLVLLLRLMVDI